MQKTVIIFMLTGFLAVSPASAHESLEHQPPAAEKPAATPAPKPDTEPLPDCNIAFAETGVCPKKNCRLECIAGFGVEDCPMVCKPIPCVEIKSEFCPTHRCQVLEGCNGRKQCYYKTDHGPNNCGDIAYAGEAVECCEGMVKRCGIEFFDGTCDMYGLNSMYSVGICIPCGNGICNQFENSCNCPEDCGAPNTSLDPADLDIPTFPQSKSSDTP